MQQPGSLAVLQLAFLVDMQLKVCLHTHTPHLLGVCLIVFAAPLTLFDGTRRPGMIPLRPLQLFQITRLFIYLFFSLIQLCWRV